MKNISNDLVLIINLSNAADWHKNNCRDNCNVSLHQLREAARIIAIKMITTSSYLTPEEILEATKIVESMPQT